MPRVPETGTIILAVLLVRVFPSTKGQCSRCAGSGILIAFLSRNDPIIVVIVGFLLAVLFVTGQTLQVFYQIPFTMVQLIEAIIVIAVASSEFLIRHRIRWTR